MSCLKRHLQTKHKHQLHQVAAQQPKIKEFALAFSPYNRKSQRKRKLDEGLCDFLATDMLPLNLIEGAGFKKYMKLVDPRYQLPSKCKLREMEMPKLMDKVKEDLKKKLNEARWVSLTTDAWTSWTNTPFLCNTSHFMRL